MGILQKLGTALDEAVFPSNIYCICCGSLIDGTRPYSLCDPCARKLHWIVGRSCVKCGKALPDTYRGSCCYDCMGFSHSFSRGYSCLTYGLHEREILMDFKYGGKGYLGAKLGDILSDRLACEDLDVDVIIPVPVSEKRRRQRGYNQTALMARRVAKRSGIPLEEKALIRVRDTALLRSLNPGEREAALAGAFTVMQKRRGQIAGRRVLLIDDIYTTGATADACTKALLASGAAEVFLLTLASGGNRRPKEL